MKALILVDVQNDFCPHSIEIEDGIIVDGALAVEDGDQVVEVANYLTSDGNFDLVIATQDWHPEDHGSFASVQGTDPFTIGDLNGLPQVWWPDHCIQESQGSEFHPNLNTNNIAAIFRKGMDIRVDSYSGFFDNGKRNSTGMGEYLKGLGVTDVYVMGLATDYCVKFTALDAAELGFNTYLVFDGCRGVNMNPDDSQIAINEMRGKGISVVSSLDLNLSLGQ